MAFARLSSILREKCGLADGEILLVGVSGGPDSLALLHALRAVGVPLMIGHFDHGLRPQSAQEADHVRSIAEDWKLPFYTEREDASAHARGNKLSIEESARELRYRFLFALAEGEGASAVAVAHTADDQVETVLMHLLRGAGLDGLSGMPYLSLPNLWSETIPLLRPLLDTWREDVEAYCAEHDLPIVRDASNQDLTFFRNRLRHKLLPVLAQYNPQAKAHLHQAAQLLSADRQLIQRLADKAWQRCVLQTHADYLQFDRQALLGEPLSLQRRLIRRAYHRLRPAARDLGSRAVQQALALAQKPQSSRQDWLDGLSILSEGEHFWVVAWQVELPTSWPQMPDQIVSLEVPGLLSLGEWQLALTQSEDLSSADRNRDAYQAWLDIERLGSQLSLRRRRPGDRFQPLGMETGTLKLADYMVNVKVPRRARAAWPLLCREDEVVWLPGYQIAHTYRLRPDSPKALHLKLTRS